MRGVITTVQVSSAPKYKGVIRINGVNHIPAPVSERVLAVFLDLAGGGPYRIEVDHRVELPVGCGFGTSGAGALSLALALNAVFDLGLSRVQAAQIAHVAEVECKTGLGTVIAETFGGLEIRVQPGAPGIGEVRTIPVDDDVRVVCLPLGPVATSKALSDADARRRINELGGKLTQSLIRNPSVGNFLSFSRRFAEHIQLVKGRVARILQEADRLGVVGSTAIFGENVFSLVPSDRLKLFVELLERYAPDGCGVIVAGIDCEGARVLDG